MTHTSTQTWRRCFKLHRCHDFLQCHLRFTSHTLPAERLMGGRGFDSEQVNPGERSASVFISPVNLNQSHTERLWGKKTHDDLFSLKSKLPASQRSRHTHWSPPDSWSQCSVRAFTWTHLLSLSHRKQMSSLEASVSGRLTRGVSGKVVLEGVLPDEVCVRHELSDRLVLVLVDVGQQRGEVHRPLDHQQVVGDLEEAGRFTVLPRNLTN